MTIRIGVAPFILILLLQGIVFACLCGNLAKHKGYAAENFAFLGFFFSVFALLYMMALPLRRDTRHPQYTGENEEAPEDGDAVVQEKAAAGNQESASTSPEEKPM